MAHVNPHKAKFISTIKALPHYSRGPLCTSAETFNKTARREVWQFSRTLVHVTWLNKHVHTRPSDTHTHNLPGSHWAKVQQLHPDACKQLDIHMQSNEGGSCGGYSRTFCSVGTARLTLSLSRAWKGQVSLYCELRHPPAAAAPLACTEE